MPSEALRVGSVVRPVAASFARCATVARAAVVAAGCLASTAACAQASDNAWIVQAGEGDRAVRSIAVGASHTFMSKDVSDPAGWSVYGEAVLGEWFVHHHDDGQRTQFTQLTAAPVLRYTFGGRLRDFFVEAGIGLTIIAPRFEDHGRQFSTTFQFDDHASFGMRFGELDANELSVRIEHFSNGGIRNPNPGQNFAQLRYARHF